MRDFDPEELRATLQPLERWRTLAFGLLLFERMLPGYFEFQARTGFAGGATLRAVQACCWRALETGDFAAHGLPSETALDAAAPDTATFGAESAARAAALAAADLVAFLRTGELARILELARRSRDGSDADERRRQQLDAAFVRYIGSWAAVAARLPPT